MGCKGCPGSENDTVFDKHGMPKNSAMEDVEKRASVNSMSYTDYISRRGEFREKARKVGNERIESMSDDYKRIQIDELVSVYNHDEVHFKLTPTQALMALWEFAHHPAYEKIFNEFVGLREQIDKKHAELQANRINIVWKPK